MIETPEFLNARILVENEMLEIQPLGRESDQYSVLQCLVLFKVKMLVTVLLQNKVPGVV